MKRCIWMAVLCLAAPLVAGAQSANPVSDTLRKVLDDNANNLVATAQEFPVAKYTYHPTPEGMTVGKTMAHIAQVNNFACAKVGGITAPAPAKAGETDKDALVANLKASMDFCKQAFAGLTDAKMGEQVQWFGGHQTSRFDAAVEVTNDLVDHYATLAVYLRLNGLLPPTAQPAAK
jgi:hypothetical protein